MFIYSYIHLLMFCCINSFEIYFPKVCDRAVVNWGGGGVYSYIHVLPDRFLFKLINLNLI